MPKNKIDDLRNHLFETLEALKDDDKPMDLDRARAIADVARVIVDSAKVEVAFMQATSGLVLCTQLGVSEADLTLDAILTQDLHADAVDVVDLQLQLQELYGVSTEDAWIDDDVLPQLTVRQVLADLRKMGAKL